MVCSSFFHCMYDALHIFNGFKQRENNRKAYDITKRHNQLPIFYVKCFTFSALSYFLYFVKLDLVLWLRFSLPDQLPAIAIGKIPCAALTSDLRNFKKSFCHCLMNHFYHWGTSLRMCFILGLFWWAEEHQGGIERTW